MLNNRRHVVVWNILRFLISPWIRWKFNFFPEKAEVSGPYLLLANHTTDWDAFFIALSFRQQTYFVASEHIFRWNFLTKIIMWLVDPISRLKASTASDAAMKVMRRLKKGYNVCIFAEGNRTWNGITDPIVPSTGKLARSCNATLVTYRLEGGFFSSPRWARSLRRGRMKGKIVGIYSKNELQAMTPNEINSLLAKDLYEDAYERQRNEPVAYKGKHLAENIEVMLCVCPKCGGIGTLKSKNDIFFCTCGLNLRYTEYGFFEGSDVPFDNITDWDSWQTRRLCDIWNDSSEGPIFSDQDIELKEILPRHRSRKIGLGEMRLYRDRIECPGMVFPLKEITGMAIHGAQSINLSAFLSDFEITSKKNFCARKYLTVFECEKAKASIKS